MPDYFTRSTTHLPPLAIWRSRHAQKSINIASCGGTLGKCPRMKTQFFRLMSITIKQMPHPNIHSGTYKHSLNRAIRMRSKQQPEHRSDDTYIGFILGLSVLATQAANNVSAHSEKTTINHASCERLLVTRRLA